MRIRFAALMAGAACLMLAACASATRQTIPIPGSAPDVGYTSTSPLVNNMANKQLATAETRRLLTLFAVPHTAQRTASGSPALSGPALGTPSGTSLVDSVRYWRVPMSLQQAGAWITAHPPRGLHPDGTASGSGPGGVDSLGYGYADDRTNPAWTQADLQIGITPAGAHASVWRVDGVAQWLDPRPQRAPHVTHPLTVDVAHGCPVSDRGADGVRPGPDDSLLPPGAPDAALICAYTGLNGHAFALTAHRLLDAAQATRLAARVDKISLAHTDGGIYNCPADFGTHTVVAFGYPHRSTDSALWLNDSGCVSISNATIMVGPGGGAGSDSFVTAVAALVR